MGDHSVTKIDHASHLLLDQPLVRLPYELLHANFRSAHYTVEKERSSTAKDLKAVANASLKGTASTADAVATLDSVLARMHSLKRKLASCADEEARLYRHVDARARHLGELQSMYAFEDVKYEQWSRKRLDRLLVDYLMRQGYGESARALAAEKGIVDLVDIETFQQMNRIRHSLLNQSVKEALEWCAENKKELRKNDSNLEFQLRFQQYVELIRSQQEDKLLEAIVFARKHLYPFKDTFPHEYAHAGVLLAFPPDTIDTGDMYHQTRWTKLADLFVQTHNQLLGVPSYPLLHVALQSGLSALKTPACHSSNSSNGIGGANTAANNNGGGAAPNSSSSSSSVCPICSTELNALARNVPYAHHDQSHVDNDLMMFPSGRVYSQRRLAEHARKAGLAEGQVKDIRTGEVVATEELRKIYIT